MLSFIIQNLGTMIVGLVVTSVVAAIIINLIKKKKQGKCIGCDSGCGGCHYDDEGKA